MNAISECRTPARSALAIAPPKCVRTITLGDGCEVTVGQYVKAWQRVKDAPAGFLFARSMTGRKPSTREEILEQCSVMVHDLINRHLPWYEKGRKWNVAWQIETRRAADNVNRFVADRIGFYWLPRWLESRVGHLKSSYRDA